ncbi:MAG: 2-oxoglutarate and iron-dependent oxygenase domain-containing protein [Thermostichus sp. BF3_bins_97]
MLTTPQHQTIPVVDFASFQKGTPLERERFVQEVGEALQQIGFFALINHGLSPTLIREAYQAAEAVFLLPEPVKRAYEDPALLGQRGYTHFGKEHAKDHPYPDLKEFWHIGREGDPSLPANVWPQEVPPFQRVMVELFAQLEACGEGLLQAVSLYLGEPANYLPETVRGGANLLRVIHYPPIPAEAPPQSLRAAAHEDINLITLLCEATAPGLELLQRDGSWLPISALPGQIIVDGGDMLQNLTNGLLRSTTHRVTNPDNDRERRFSIPFFVHPRAEVDLTPLPACVARTGGIPQFPSLTAGEYLTQRLTEIGLAGSGSPAKG